LGGSAEAVHRRFIDNVAIAIHGRDIHGQDKGIARRAHGCQKSAPGVGRGPFNHDLASRVMTDAYRLNGQMNRMDANSSGRKNQARIYVSLY
jgi:hypothetical protein